ncbi:hypothetical protein Pmani_000030 [Petrolisthes manimaculis]|uniref:Uncharacterized protein n=1 Tax=Petrolisthes manimaculis TaxID=1843537 RepID=A0AAE1UMR3_9EUCA|nr:hypothetical protein Pmani_000030 [Petrolisthes manimaculis]
MSSEGVAAAASAFYESLAVNIQSNKIKRTRRLWMRKEFEQGTCHGDLLLFEPNILTGKTPRQGPSRSTMMPLLFTVLLLALANCEALLEPKDEAQSMDVKTRYQNEDVVLQKADIDQVEDESVMERRFSIVAKVPVKVKCPPGGCCTSPG